MGPWSFVGRTDDLNRLVNAATGRTGRGLIVSGTAGIGKSRLLRETVEALPPDRFAVFPAWATIATAGLPFGGVAQILPADPPAGLSPTGLLRWAVESLHEQAGQRPIVLAVDDVHLLDPSSAALVYLVARSAHGTVLGTFRSRERLPVPIRGLWTDDLVDHVELAPLGVAETTTLLTEMLGGPVETASAQRLWRLSAGHPLLLRELVTAAHAGHEMIQAYGVWRWTGRLEFAPSLIDLVDARIGQLTTEVRTVVELVALGEPIGLELVIRATDEAHVEAAEERDLIRVLDDDRRHNVALTHPLYGEVVRRRCPVTRSRRLYARLAALVEEAGARRRDDPLRVALWRVDSGTAQDPRLLLTAGAQALSRLELHVAARLARGALTAGGGFDAAELLAAVLMLRDEPGEALSVLESVRDGVTSDEQRSRWSATRGLISYWGLGREETVDDLAADAKALTDPAARALLHAVEAVMRLQRLECPESLRLARAVLDEPAASVPARALASCAAAYLQAAQGDLRRSAQSIAAVAADAPRWRTQLPHLQLAVEMARGTRLVLAGDLPGIDAVSANEFAGLADAGDFRSGSGCLSLVRGQAARLRGQTGEALRRSLQACAALRPGHAVVRLAHAERAHAAALRGEAAEAAAAMADSDAVQTPGMDLFYPWREQARCWVAVSAGDLARGVRVLRELLDRLTGDGFAGHEVVALHDLVRLGRADLAVGRLSGLAGALDGPLPALVARQAKAAHTGSAAELLAVADDFADLGLNLFAAEAAAMAVTRLRATRAPQAVEASGRLGDLLERCDAVATPALRTGQPSLTGRERQIARLAAKGVTSRDIAEQLFISTRTVENHLQRVYSKLGVTSRGELAPALRALPDLDVAAGR